MNPKLLLILPKFTGETSKCERSLAKPQPVKILRQNPKTRKFIGATLKDKHSFMKPKNTKIHLLDPKMQKFILQNPKMRKFTSKL